MRPVKAVFGPEAALVPPNRPNPARRPYKSLIYLHTPIRHVILEKFNQEALMVPARPKIKLYTLSTCSHCNRTKRFFKDCGIDVEFTDVDLLSAGERAAILDEVRKLNPDCSFPTICIGDLIIVGFNEEKLRKALDLS
jgi:glutaredoxin-like protein NrdH